MGVDMNTKDRKDKSQLLDHWVTAQRIKGFLYAGEKTLAHLGTNYSFFLKQ